MLLNASRLGLRTAFLLMTVTSLYGGNAVADAPSSAHHIPGLIAPVEILKDEWGISHIYAENQSDLFFAQGYSAARDRLFQFEIWRRRALGLMAEIQGEKALPHDIGARLLMFRGDMQAEMQHYHQDGAEIITAFVRGVNAYIDETRQDPSLLPIEFRLLGIAPGYWTPEIVVSRHNALTGGAAMEITIAALVDLIGSETTQALLPFAQTPYLEPQTGVALADIRKDLMASYIASRNPPAFTVDDLAPDMQHNEATAPLVSLNDPTFMLTQPVDATTMVGSNNWLIHGSKTESGYPIMANDPHRAISMPSLRYWAHLVAPGWNVIGGGEPVLPGISIGHNEYGAWGLTIFPIDQEDLYVYETNPANPNQYRYDGNWEDMTLVSETIPVKGQDSVTVTLKYTRHGPVLHEKQAENKAFSVRAAWLEVGAAPYLASLRMDQADSWQAFRDACAYSGLPGENMIWIDKEGNIGWQSVGLTPLRIGWDGLLPVPGDGRFEWAGFAPIKSMPHLLNPESGYFQTANQINVPDGYPNIFNFFGADTFRFDRIGELLAPENKATIAHSKAVQFDELSIPARTLVPLLTKLKPKSAAAKKAQKLLLGWNYVMAADSTAATLYDSWEAMLRKGLRAAVLPEEFHPYLGDVSLTKTLAWLQNPNNAPTGMFKGNPTKARDTLLLHSLELAVEQITALLGQDMANWQYGQEKIHYSKIIHPLSHLVEKPLADTLNIGGDPKGGSPSTLNISWGKPRHGGGPSLRIISDASDWDKTVGTNTPGQSGNPDSPLYSNLYEGWLQGDYFPVYYSRDKIMAVTREVTKLIPAPK